LTTGSTGFLVAGTIGFLVAGITGFFVFGSVGIFVVIGFGNGAGGDGLGSGLQSSVSQNPGLSHVTQSWLMSDKSQWTQ